MILPIAIPAPMVVAGPVVHRIALPNGLALGLVQDHSRPTFRLRLQIAFEAQGLDRNRAALGHVLARVLLERTLGAKDASKEHPFMVAGEWTGHRLIMNLEGPSESLEGAFQWLSQWIGQRRMERDPVDRVRQRLRTSPLSKSEGWLAQQCFFEGLQGWACLPWPEDGVLAQGGVQELEQAHADFVHPRCTTLSLVGDLDPLQLRGLAWRTFGAWEGGRLPRTAAPASTVWLVGGREETTAAWVGLPHGAKGWGELAGLILDARLFWEPPEGAQPWKKGQLHPGGWVLKFDGLPTQGSPLVALGRWLDRQRDRLPTASELEAAQVRLRTRLGVLALDPLALLGRLAEQQGLEAPSTDLASFQREWQECLAPSRRHVLVLGADKAEVEALRQSGHATPQWIRLEK